MRKISTASGCRVPRHTPSRKVLAGTLRGGLLVFLAGALVALAGTPANLQEALQAQRGLVAEHPRDADLLNDLGNLLALAGDFAEAEEAYRQALDVDPDDVTSLYNLALVLREQGDRKQAQKVLRSILELDPRHAWSHYQLGTLYAEQKNRSKAVHHYAAAFSADRSLTSPKVNPHIVENRLATDALLTMYVDDSPSTQAPRIYEEPGAVADLLLPRGAAEQQTEPPVETAPGGETVPPSGRSRVSYPPSEEGPATGSSSDADSSDPAADQESNRRLDTSTLRARQAAPSTPRENSGQPLGSATSGTNPVDDPGFDQSPTGGVAGAPSSSLVAPSGSVATPSGDTVDSPGEFTPGLQSTGRLDLELLPAVETAPALSST